jgi:Protein of unknown function (DUF3485)
VKKSQWLALLISIGLIGGAACVLTWFKQHQKLGRPGLKATAIPGKVKMKINLPEHVLDFTSTNVPEPEVVLDYLPKDTSYAERCYQNSNGYPIYATAILMGADRTSIHRPEYCLPGQGFQINSRTVVKLLINRPYPYQLPVSKWIVGKTIQTPDGQNQKISGLYVFWFVANHEQTTGIVPMQLRMMKDLLTTGVLQRWAYISYFTFCLPGQEKVAFDRMKKLIENSVPEYQLPPGKTVKN